MKTIFLLCLFLLVCFGSLAQTTDEKLSTVEKELKEAIANEDYAKAAELKKKKQLLTEIKEAVANEDYAKAAELKKQLAGGTNKNDNPPVKTVDRNNPDVNALPSFDYPKYLSKISKVEDIELLPGEQITFSDEETFASKKRTILIRNGVVDLYFDEENKIGFKFEKGRRLKTMTYTKGDVFGGKKTESFRFSYKDDTGTEISTITRSITLSDEKMRVLLYSPAGDMFFDCTNLNTSEKISWGGPSFNEYIALNCTCFDPLNTDQNVDHHAKGIITLGRPDKTWQYFTEQGQLHNTIIFSFGVPQNNNSTTTTTENTNTNTNTNTVKEPPNKNLTPTKTMSRLHYDDAYAGTYDGCAYTFYAGYKDSKNVYYLKDDCGHESFYYWRDATNEKLYETYSANGATIGVKYKKYFGNTPDEKTAINAIFNNHFSTSGINVTLPK